MIAKYHDKCVCVCDFVLYKCQLMNGEQDHPI